MSRPGEREFSVRFRVPKWLGRWLRRRGGIGWLVRFSGRMLGIESWWRVTPNEFEKRERG